MQDVSSDAGLISKRPSESKTSECVKLLKDALRGVLFTDSTDEELDKVMFVMQRLVADTDSHVITQGDSGDKFYVVQSGSLEVIVNTAIVGYLTTGDHFGELALIYDGMDAFSLSELFHWLTLNPSTQLLAPQPCVLPQTLCCGHSIATNSA